MPPRRFALLLGAVLLAAAVTVGGAALLAGPSWVAGAAPTLLVATLAAALALRLAGGRR